MSESLFSPSWYRVAQLRPRLRSHAQIHRHTYRDDVWYVLQDHASGRYHRISPSAHYLIGLMDGRRSMHEIWEASMERLGDDGPTQEEAIQLMAQLHAADVLQSDVTPDSVELFERHQRLERFEWIRRLWSPLALRFPLFDPDRFLDRWLPVIRPLLGWFGAIVWLACVGSAVVLAAFHWPDLTENVADRVLAPQNLLLLWLVYPAIKLVHELGHGFATKTWGGEVHEMGVMLLVLMPIPYVDASAASAFRERRRRMLVGAAGILVELFLAAIAMFVWLSVESGIVSAIAYNVMLIGGVSTVLFNGNPLLRFDGYYIFADALDIPNLGTRANKYFGYLFQRYLFGVRDAASPADTPYESRWFFLYGIASFIYRMFIMVFIVLFVASKLFFIGIILAFWAAFTQLGLPIVKIVKFLLTSPKLRRQRVRAVSTSVALLSLLLALITLVPVPLRTRAEGVVWLPEQAQVRAGAEGFVNRLLVDPEAQVRRGQALIENYDPFLSTRLRVIRAELSALEARFRAEWAEDPVRAEITREELNAIRADLDRARERALEMIVRSPTDGQLVVPKHRDLEGRFVRQGEVVAYVVDYSQLTVRVVVAQDDIGLIRGRTEDIQVRLAEQLDTVFTAHIRREVPAGSDQLPSPALSTLGGGQFSVDPRVPKELKTLERVFQFDLELPAGTPVSGTGGRVYVRFGHGSEPLARQWYRQGRQLFLRRFGI